MKLPLFLEHWTITRDQSLQSACASACECAHTGARVCSCLRAPVCSGVHTCRIWPVAGWRPRCCQEKRDEFLWSLLSLWCGPPFTVKLQLRADRNAHTHFPFTCHWWSSWPSFCYSSAPVPFHFLWCGCTWLCMCTCLQEYKMHNFSSLSQCMLHAMICINFAGFIKLDLRTLICKV